MSESKQVAITILQQLGGNKFRAMTGARNFVSTPYSLLFKIPQTMTRNRISHVNIALNSMDTYDVTFSNVRGFKIKEISKHEGIYDNMLQPLFIEETGLNLYLR